MDSGLMITLSMGLTHGAAIVWGIWELWTLRRSGPPRDRRLEPPVAPMPPLGTGKPLPDCLIPRPMPVTRVRVLEDA